MGKSILITGGARSGKSKYAEKLAKGLGGNILYIATALAFDDEMKKRIKMHKESRPEEWHTYEGYKKLGDYIKAHGNQYKGILIDCVTIMVTNIILENVGFDNPNPNIHGCEKAETIIKQEIDNLMAGIKETQTTVILVTNELGSGVVPENLFARVFRDIAGRANQQVAEQVDEVYLSVCGIPLKIKGE